MLGLNEHQHISAKKQGFWFVQKEEIGTTIYIGKLNTFREWLVQKLDTSSGTSMTYATVKNNPSVTSYADAWTNRASLTYGDPASSL